MFIKIRDFSYMTTYCIVKRLRDMSLAVLLSIFIQLVLDFQEDENYILVIGITFVLTITLDGLIMCVEKRLEKII